jgi:xanthine dehydrogenase YagT iron-sulfur-binding subunit
MEITINGHTHAFSVDPRTSLLDLLRDHLGLTGSKKGCNQGACGACTVLADGQRINACFALAVQYVGRDIVTVEGLAGASGLHPLQQEIERGVPSYVSENLAAEGFSLTHDEIRERMSGNLCRCGAYNGIVDAIHATMGEQVAEPEKREAA